MHRLLCSDRWRRRPIGAVVMRNSKTIWQGMTRGKAAQDASLRRSVGKGFGSFFHRPAFHPSLVRRGLPVAHPSAEYSRRLRRFVCFAVLTTLTAILISVSLPAGAQTLREERERAARDSAERQRRQEGARSTLGRLKRRPECQKTGNLAKICKVVIVYKKSLFFNRLAYT